MEIKENELYFVQYAVLYNKSLTINEFVMGYELVDKIGYDLVDKKDLYYIRLATEDDILNSLSEDLKKHLMFSYESKLKKQIEEYAKII